MANFLFGIQGLGSYMAFLIRAMAYQPLVWGFSLGFAASTMFYAFIASENPRMIPHILTKPLHKSYTHISSKDSNGSFLMSYVHFEEEYNRVRMVFASAILAFLVVVGISLIRF